jgi:hypothetical protein
LPDVGIPGWLLHMNVMLDYASKYVTADENIMWAKQKLKRFISASDDT